MNAAQFVRTRPCLEEIDGYLQQAPLSTEEMAVVEAFRQRLLVGKETPAPSLIERGYEYKLKRKPKRRARSPAVGAG